MMMAAVCVYIYRKFAILLLLRRWKLARLDEDVLGSEYLKGNDYVEKLSSNCIGNIRCEMLAFFMVNNFCIGFFK